MNKKALIFLILFVLSFFVSFFLSINKIKIPYFGAIYKDVQVDVIFKNEVPKVFYDDKEIKNVLKIDNTHYVFSAKENNLIKKVSFNKTENIENLIIYIEKGAQFFKEVPNEISIDNNKNILDKATIAFLSLFYNWQFYIIAYIFLFLFLYNYKTDLKPKNYVISLLFVGFLLRLAQINFIPFWDDEIYILAATAPYAKLAELFQDPGNPPLYFILFKIYRSIIQNPEFFRFSSVILGLLFNICFYIYLKAFLGKKRSLIGLFIVTINAVLIYFSQEIRCYMLLMLLVVINSYLFFKFNKRTKISYLFSTIALLYTHFYASFFVFYNFIVGLILFKKEKLKSFLITNFIAFLSFLPLLIYKKQALASDFNSWMKIPIIEDYMAVIGVFVGNVIFGIIFVILLIFAYKKINKKREKLFFNYNLYSFFVVFVLAVLFSYLIKPIFCYRYFYVVYPAYLTLVVMIVFCLSKTKLKSFAAILALLFLTINAKINYQNLFCNHNLFLDYVKHDIDTTKHNYILASDTVEKYKEFVVDNANMVYIQVNKGANSVNLRKENFKENSVFYILNLYLSADTYKVIKKITLFKTVLGVYCKVEM